VDDKASEYVGGFGRFRHYAQVFTPENRDVVTPNNDTPYSWAWLDLRVKVLREVEVENRFQGTIGLLEVSFPLWVASPKAAPEAKPLLTKF